MSSVHILNLERHFRNGGETALHQVQGQAADTGILSTLTRPSLLFDDAKAAQWKENIPPPSGFECFCLFSSVYGWLVTGTSAPFLDRFSYICSPFAAWTRSDGQTIGVLISATDFVSILVFRNIVPIGSGESGVVTERGLLPVDGVIMDK